MVNTWTVVKGTEVEAPEEIMNFHVGVSDLARRTAMFEFPVLAFAVQTRELQVAVLRLTLFAGFPDAGVQQFMFVLQIPSELGAARWRRSVVVGPDARQRKMKKVK